MLPDFVSIKSHAAERSIPIVTSAGMVDTHVVVFASGHLGWKVQPLGRLDKTGGCPPIATIGLVTSKSTVHTELISAFV